MTSLSHYNLPTFVYHVPSHRELREQYGKDAPVFIIREILWRKRIRTFLSEMQNHKCCYCGREVNNIESSKLQASVEHVVPQSRGGKHIHWRINGVMACAKCNNKRQTKPIEVEAMVWQMVCDEVGKELKKLER